MFISHKWSQYRGQDPFVAFYRATITSVRFWSIRTECKNSVQGSVIKHGMGLLKRSHHTAILQALNLSPVEDIINSRLVSLHHYILMRSSPARDIRMFFLSICMHNIALYKGTLLDRFVGPFPRKSKNFSHKVLSLNYDNSSANGLVDTLKFLLCHDNFTKSWLKEDFIATLLKFLSLFLVCISLCDCYHECTYHVCLLPTPWPWNK